jgi:porin
MHRSDLISICNGRAATAGLLIAVAILFVKAGTVLAEESDQTPVSGVAATPGKEGADQAEPPCPPPSVPDFGGCLKHLSYLTGDWGGLRPSLAEKGITFDDDVTQFYFGDASGGLQQEFRYGGHADLVVNTDFGKLGIQEGLFLKLRAEDRFGESLSGVTGAFLPQELAADLPVPSSENLYLTDVLVTQALSESFALFAGKMDTLDGDANAFAHGRGIDQFSNVAFVFNPIALRTVPYSTLGAGFAILRDMQPLFTFTVLNAIDTTQTSGFDQLFAQGATLNAELRVPTKFFELPGHQLLGGTWSSRDYVALGQDPRVILPSVPIQRADGSWCLYWNFDQYLKVFSSDPLRGWGVFGRAGIGDDTANPISWFLSFGVGGNSPLCGRESDTFGAGWYYSGTSGNIGPILQTVLGPIGDGQGVELFYNIAVTPWLNVTPDLQVVVPARENVDTAVVAGLRAKMVF